MGAFKFLKDNFPCRDCITYPICKSKLLDLLKKERARTVYYSTTDYYKIMIFYCAKDCFVHKCSLYVKYLFLFLYNVHEKTRRFSRREVEIAISDIIRQVFKLGN